MFENLISLFNNKSVKKTCKVDKECQKKMEKIQTNYVETEPKIEPLTFYDMKRPELFITSVYDLEILIKKSLIVSTQLLNKFISANVTNKTALIFYSHAIRYILDDISELSVFIEELSKEDLINTIKNALSCLSELYSCCGVIKENYRDDISSEPIRRSLVEIIKLIEPYIKVKDEKIDYEELYKKVFLKKTQNMITNEIGKCVNPKKINEISYIVTMLLREDLRDVEDIAEIIRKRRLISRDLFTI
ncbi:hypothetical protein [Clostridium estertheticum]|uniref:hypothetical protein n=1 Tax=Clostridium estertheticum TaxID=238834 RepID=UPI001C0AEB66|nr:hypothetical protein [Clostridium estertheticum]MBU3173381.1 hypothetical protein [Clostridium estertheticum]